MRALALIANLICRSRVCAHAWRQLCCEPCFILMFMQTLSYKVEEGVEVTLEAFAGFKQLTALKLDLRSSQLENLHVTEYLLKLSPKFGGGSNELCEEAKESCCCFPSCSLSTAISCLLVDKLNTSLVSLDHKPCAILPITVKICWYT